MRLKTGLVNNSLYKFIYGASLFQQHSNYLSLTLVFTLKKKSYF